MEYKDSYTSDEVQGLVDWFEGKELPKAMRIDEATCSSNLPLTVESLCLQALLHYENTTFNNSIRLLYKIKEKLEAVLVIH